MSAVDYARFLHDAELARYLPTLNEFWWQNQLAGHTSRGVLRLPDRGATSRHPQVIAWDQISEVRIDRVVSVQGLILAFVWIGLTVVIFYGGWIQRSVAGFGTYTIPLCCGPIGVWFLLGARRCTIKVCTEGKWLRWLAPPLKLAEGLPFCVALQKLCQQRQVTHRVRLNSWRPEW